MKEKDKDPLLLIEYIAELIKVLCISMKKGKERMREWKLYLDVRSGFWRVFKDVGAEAESDTMWFCCGSDC